jgi:hypothetical protein
MSMITDAFIKSRKKDDYRIVQMSIPTRCLFVSKDKEHYLNEYWIHYYVTDGYDIGINMGVEKIDLKYFLWGFSTGYIPPGDYLTSKYDYRIFSDSQKWSWEYDKYEKNIKDWGF